MAVFQRLLGVKDRPTLLHKSLQPLLPIGMSRAIAETCTLSLNLRLKGCIEGICEELLRPPEGVK